MDDTINDQMFEALAETEEKNAEVVNVNIDGQKQYIGRNVNKVDKAARYGFVRLMILNDLREELQWVNDGTLINLDHLSDEIIQQLYMYIQYHVEK